eukprot:jgi/Chrpa1/17377/Chrysochromulina_OHIO_Genome00021637-RA
MDSDVVALAVAFAGMVRVRGGGCAASKPGVQADARLGDIDEDDALRESPPSIMDVSPPSIMDVDGLQKAIRELLEGDAKIRRPTGTAQIQLTQKKAIELLPAQSTMLTTLLLGTRAAPKLVLFLPVPHATGKGKGKGKALSPNDWLNHRVRIFFVDPLTYTVAKTHPNREGEAEGFELTLPREWVVKAMPYVKLGLTVLKVAAAAGKLTGFPIPDLRSMIDSQLSALDGFKEEAITN